MSKIKNIFRPFKKEKEQKEEKNYEIDYKSFIRDREGMRKIIHYYREDERDFFSKYEFLYKDSETEKIYDVSGKDVTEFYKDKIKP